MTANQFRTALDRLSLTQAQAATFLGKSLRTVWGYCNGEPIDHPVALLLHVMLEHDLTPEDVQP
jgi:hypothetical protein